MDGGNINDIVAYIAAYRVGTSRWTGLSLPNIACVGCATGVCMARGEREGERKRESERERKRESEREGERRHAGTVRNRGAHA